MASSSHDLPYLRDLRYLGFIELLAEKATKHVANVYAFAKENTGPFKPSVHGVETTVKIIIGPVCEKLDGKPHEILLFVEKKVDHVVRNIDGAFFHNVKETSYHAYDVARHIPEVVKIFVDELQHGDIVETAKMCYTTYEPLAEEWSYAAWIQFLKLPYALQAVNFATPAMLFCAKNFNYVMNDLKEMHVPLVGYMPNIPMEKLERILKVHVE